jgi:hypothetical protein
LAADKSAIPLLPEGRLLGRDENIREYVGRRITTEVQLPKSQSLAAQTLQVVRVDRNAGPTKDELGPLVHGANIVIPNHDVLSLEPRSKVTLFVVLLKTIRKEQ